MHAYAFDLRLEEGQRQLLRARMRSSHIPSSSDMLSVSRPSRTKPSWRKEPLEIVAPWLSGECTTEAIAHTAPTERPVRRESPRPQVLVPRSEAEALPSA